MRKQLLAFMAVLIMLACLAGCSASNQAAQTSSQAGDSGSPSTAETAGQASTDASTAETADQASASTTAEEASSEASADSTTAVPSGQASVNASASETTSQAIGSDLPTQNAQASFASWNADAASLAKLVAYVQAATEEGGAGYVAPEDRIAVFDMDGTFICEKAPVYMDYMLLLHRVQDDPSFTPTDEMRALCDDIRTSADEGVPLNDADRAYKKNDALAESFAGMTFDEFHAYVTNFMATEEVEGFSGMTYGESFYKPMLEVIEFLQANDFNVYVVTACEREVVRAVVEPLGIDAAHVIGSDWAYTASNQGGEEGQDYTYEKADDLLIAGYYLGETGKTNKVIAIQREIGKHPVLAFGNSSGDFAMLNYTLDNDENPSASFLVVADDTQREYGNDQKAAEMRSEADATGWITISMRDDWATIYGDGVEKTQLRADETQELAEAA